MQTVLTIQRENEGISRHSTTDFPNRESQEFRQQSRDAEVERVCGLHTARMEDLNRLFAQISAVSLSGSFNPSELLELRSLLVRAEQQLREQSRIFAELQSLALTDDLTGLYNRRGFLVLGLQLLKMARRNGQAALLFFFDVDHFKQINDRYGHGVGDQCLVSCSRALRETFRGSDVVARFGGDEFVVLALEVNGHDERAVTVRLQNAIQGENAKRCAHELSISTGIARFERNMPPSMTELLIAADADMYRHKIRIIETART